MSQQEQALTLHQEAVYGTNVAAVCKFIFSKQDAPSATEIELQESFIDSPQALTFLATAAMLFTNEADIHSDSRTLNLDEAIEDFSDKLMGCLVSEKLPDSSELSFMAAGSIEKNFQ